MCAPRRRPAAMSRPTLAGVGGERRRLLAAGGHLRPHPSGPRDEDVDAARGERVAEALGERVEAGLRRAVGVVRLAGAVAGDRGDDDDRAAALAAEALAEDREDADGADEVRARDPDRGARRRAWRGPGRRGRRTRRWPRRGCAGRRAAANARVDGGLVGVGRVGVEGDDASCRGRARRALPAAVARSGSRTARTTRSRRSSASASTVATAISELPPKTAAVRIGPSASACLVRRAVMRARRRRGEATTGIEPV